MSLLSPHSVSYWVTLFRYFVRWEHTADCSTIIPSWLVILLITQWVRWWRYTLHPFYILKRKKTTYRLHLLLRFPNTLFYYYICTYQFATCSPLGILSLLPTARFVRCACWELFVVWLFNSPPHTPRCCDVGVVGIPVRVGWVPFQTFGSYCCIVQ